jgi:adenine-specific DNA-methyltransferase
MGSIRYIGSKTRLTDWIMEISGPPPEGWVFHDLFSGTGAVSAAAAENGWRVAANDLLLSATIQTKARLISSNQAKFQKLGGYGAVIEMLNSLSCRKGFFFREYTASALNSDSQPRGYFSIPNGMKIDAIRSKILELKKTGEINEAEHVLLLSDLMVATNAVANTAGTYGCFLSKESPAAKGGIILKQRSLPSYSKSHIVTNDDVFNIRPKENSLAYLDPPYTKRQYAAYYHILETIAHEDFPKVEGVTGLRPWKNNSSLFCYKRHAFEALKKLIKEIRAQRILLSYSSDGHVSSNEIISYLKELGSLRIHESPGFKRYTPNEKSRKRANKEGLTEFIFDLSR